MSYHPSAIGTYRNSVQETVASYPVRVIFFILIHIPLAFAFRWNSDIATVHALGTFGLGLWFLAHDKYPYRLIYLTAYITGAELLWRGMHASIFYEFGKYAVGFLFMVGLLKYRRFTIADKRPLLYFVLLLPSILVMPVFDREMIAFNLTGPFSLAVATMFFSAVKLSEEQMKRVFVALMAPIIGLAFLASYISSAHEKLILSGKESIFVTSAGIGPNQVSSVLGLGALAAFLYFFSEHRHRSLRLLIGCSMVWLLVQATLTFSRGGVWTGTGAICLALLYLIRDRRLRSISILTMAGLLLLSYFFVFPFLSEYREGAVSQRFRSLEPTGRDSIVQGDLEAYMENPILGVGPHQSKAYHARKLLFAASTHTEYTRLLAEHGSFGLAAFLILFWMLLERLTKKLSFQSKAYSMAFIAWTLLYMLHAAMRLVAPSFMFGLAFATIVPAMDNPKR